VPTVGLFHTNYWEFSDTNFPRISTNAAGGYPMWQASVITPSLFGIVGAWIDARVALLKWHWRHATRVHRLSRESRGVIERVLSVVEDPRYRVAQEAVRATSKTLGFNRPEAWKGLSRQMKDQPGRAENVFRHMNACELLRKGASSTLANYEQNLYVELAYHGYTISRK